jgi:hypothetical protein
LSGLEQGSGTESAIWAGVIAGLAGVAVFLVAHHLWIVPIWFVAPAGAMVAGLGGAAVGAAYDALRAHLPRRPWTPLMVAAVFGGMLVPAVILADIRGPIFAMDATGGGTLLVSGAEALAWVLVSLVGVTVAMGAALGRLIGRSRRAVATTMLAAVAMAVGPGHNIPLLGGTPVVGKELAILGAAMAVASIVLVEADVRLAGRHDDRRASPQGYGQ